MYWVSYKQQKFISLKAGKFKIKAPIDPVSDKSSLLALLTLASLSGRGTGAL